MGKALGSWQTSMLSELGLCSYFRGSYVMLQIEYSLRVLSRTLVTTSERCVQHGQWSSRIRMPDLSVPLRTDAGFHAEDYEGHHIRVPPLLQLSRGMVSSFPLVYMHLICLGYAQTHWSISAKHCVCNIQKYPIS